MNFVIAKYSSRTGSRDQKHKLILTNATLYELPDGLATATEYSPETLIENTEWYKIELFSSKLYFPVFLSTITSSVNFTRLDTVDANSISYICACQDNCTKFYFQRVPKTHLRRRKAIEIGSTFKYEENSCSISINDISDALYDKSTNTLYFKKLESITSIFKGIDVLYREATEEETHSFLNKDFISLNGDFSSTYVKKANRKRIALAVSALEGYDEEQKDAIFNNIREYCEGLVTADNTFLLTNESDLELLTLGILQRFYTTADGREKRIANSIKSFS